ncbi:MAG: MotA/TolQ/ExbB proton channel family protein [Deltaproteobacteria bacterium]|nr:MotA/TolQ/ExbB proton channel family protein [Deltaproteobacteria bacterium]
MFGNLSFIGLLQKGGITVIILGILSVVSITIILERIWAFRKFKAGLAAFFDTLERTFKEGGLTAAAGLCGGIKSPLSQVFLSGYKKRGKKKETIAEAMELAGRAELQKLERFLGVLGTIGSTAPFIGLFGTVLGIIRAFSDMALTQGASPAAVADGIAEALVATAAGLFVAVPAVAAYNYFVRTISKHGLELETCASEFIDPLTAPSEVEEGRGKP